MLFGEIISTSDDPLKLHTLFDTIKIAVAGSIAATVLFRRRDVAFVLVAVWASAGIAVKQAAVPSVAGAATVIALLGILLVAAEFISRRQS